MSRRSRRNPWFRIDPAEDVMQIVADPWLQEVSDALSREMDKLVMDTDRVFCPLPTAEEVLVTQTCTTHRMINCPECLPGYVHDTPHNEEALRDEVADLRRQLDTERRRTDSLSRMNASSFAHWEAARKILVKCQTLNDSLRHTIGWDPISQELADELRSMLRPEPGQIPQPVVDELNLMDDIGKRVILDPTSPLDVIRLLDSRGGEARILVDRKRGVVLGPDGERTRPGEPATLTHQQETLAKWRREPHDFDPGHPYLCRRCNTEKYDDRHTRREPIVVRDMVDMVPEAPSTSAPFMEMIGRAHEELKKGDVVIEVTRDQESSIPMLLWCPSCHARHVDVGEFKHHPHHTHACQSCGMVWRPAIACTVGVDFLPGFRDA